MYSIKTSTTTENGLTYPQAPNINNAKSDNFSYFKNIQTDKLQAPNNDSKNDNFFSYFKYFQNILKSGSEKHKIPLESTLVEEKKDGKILQIFIFITEKKIDISQYAKLVMTKV